MDGDGDLDAIFDNVNRPDSIYTNNGNGLFSDSGQMLNV